MTDDLSTTVANVLAAATRIRVYELRTQPPDDLVDIQREVLKGRVEKLLEQYGQQLAGTPEAVYFDALAGHYGIYPAGRFNRSVDELELSVRTYNSLKAGNYVTIGDVVCNTEAQLLKTKNFNRKSLNELKEVLGSMGLHLGMQVPQTSAEPSQQVP